MLKIVAGLLAVALLAGTGWQHARYTEARRGPVQDRQAPFYGSSTFHVVTFLRAASDANLVHDLRMLRGELAETGGEWIYAGIAPFVGLESEQLGPGAWNAVVLLQFPSREAYDAVATTPSYRSALGRFERSYSHGMQRPVLLNLALPVGLLGVRAFDVLRRTPSHYPFAEAAPDVLEARGADAAGRIAQLDAVRELGHEAIVVVNLLRDGDAEQRAANRAYALKMAGLFAEGGHGPMHVGDAVPVEGGAEFDSVALVYYPGVLYFRQMLQSAFFNGIVAGKQVGDTLAVPTVPVLSQL